MASRKTDPKFIGESVGLLEEQIDRIQRIVRGASQFSCVSHENWTSCQVDSVLNEVIEVLKMDGRQADSRFGPRSANSPRRLPSGTS